MSKRYEIKLNRSASEVFAHADKTAGANGIQLIGNDQHGRFSGRGMEGGYQVEGDVLAIDVQKKPLIMPWAFIEATIKNVFS